MAAILEKSFPEAELTLSDAAGSCMEKCDLEIHGGGKLYQMPAPAMAVITEEQLPERAHFFRGVVRAVSWACELQGTGSKELTKTVKELSFTSPAPGSLLLLEESFPPAGLTSK